MTDASLPAGRFATGEFRIGRVISRTFSVLSRNIVKFSVVTGIAVLPTLLFPQPSFENAGNPFTNVPLMVIALVLFLVLSLLSQAIIFYGAFQDMRGRPVNLSDGLQVSLGRFFPLIGLGFIIFMTLIGIAIVTGLLAAVPIVVYFTPLIIIPVVTLFVAWSMGTPACVVEQVGPVRSLGRSQELTKGSRWRILGLFLLTAIPGLIISVLVGAVMGCDLCARSRRAVADADRDTGLAGDLDGLLLHHPRRRLPRPACRQGRHRHRSDRLRIRVRGATLSGSQTDRSG
jgi:uncharacterized membrane protein